MSRRVCVYVIIPPRGSTDSSPSFNHTHSVWVLLLVMAGLIVAFWFIAHGIALQYLVLFIGVMSCLYSVWDIIDGEQS